MGRERNAGASASQSTKWRPNELMTENKAQPWINHDEAQTGIMEHTSAYHLSAVVCRRTLAIRGPRLHTNCRAPPVP
jgi:hypothetical protein